MDINPSFALILYVFIVISKFLHCGGSDNVNSSSIISNERKSYRIVRERSIPDNDDRFLGFHFTEEPTNTIAKAGRVELNCRYAVSIKNLSSRIEWRKDGAELGSLRSAGKVFVASSGSLIIENVGSTDEGLYQCAVHVTDKKSFVWTYLSRRATVRLPFLSRFEIQPEDREVHTGQNVAFACMLDSQPSAHIEWFFNGKRISDRDDSSITIFPITSTLEISSVLPKHEGAYRCVATNEGKTRSSRDAQLTIKPENSVDNEFSEPYFILEPRGDVVKEGESVVLECLVNGWPRPDVRWLKGAETISITGDGMRQLGSSSFIILKAKAQDAGVYTCRASNSQESLDASATIQVKVAPKIISEPNDVVAQETTDVEFNCEASGEPGPAISWYKNGETIIASEYFVIEATRLRVLGLVRNDQGVYQCIAENDAGSVQSNAQLIVDSSDSFSMAASSGQPKLPSEPLGVRASVVGSRFVVLTWDPPVQHHGAVLAYHIFYKEQDSSRERMLNSSATSFTVTPLQPNTTYVFRLVAENEAGMGKSSTRILITTTEEKAVPGKVKNLHGTALSPETVEVSWEPPGGNGPEPVQYKLFYIRKNHEPNEKETQIVMKKTSYTLHGMEKYVEYIIRVEAEGVNGAGLSSEPITVRTLSDLPSLPPSDVRAEAISTTSILVQWTSLSAEDRNGILTGYRIKYKTRLRGAKSNTLVVDGNNSSYTMSGLEPGTQYMLRVAAVNQNGSGPNSDWVHVDTPLEDKDEGQVAGPPLSLKVQPSLDSIQLSWLPPRDDSVMIRGYLIGWGINIPDVDQVKVPANLRFYTINGLRPGRDYVISLRAYNMIGNGFPIYETVRTLSPDSKFIANGQQNSRDSGRSETPIGVRALTLSSSSIRVAWTDAEMDMPYSRQYTVRYGSSIDNGGQRRYINTSELEVIVDGLRPNTQYEFAVRVNAGKSSSMWSMTAVNSTYPAPPSSAPRDLTIMQPTDGDPQTLILNWQPPKYANGDIEEYLVYYADRSDAPDKDWVLDGVKGDHLSIKLTNLLPRQTYFFKVQARNIKGYGPLSPTLQFVPGAPSPRIFQSVDIDLESPGLSLFSTPVYLALMAAIIVLLMMLLITVIWYVRSKKSKKSTASGYMRGRKQTRNGKGPPDLWINHHNGGNQMHEPEDLIEDALATSSNDLNHCGDVIEMVDSPRSQYLTVQAHFTDPEYIEARMTQSAHDGIIQRRRPVGKAELISTHAVMSQNPLPGNGTLTRSYHQSSTSLEGRQRTPQIVYTNTGRHQVAKIDFSDHSSTYSSSQALHLSTPPPPQLPNQGPPVAPPSQLLSSDGYRTLRRNSVSSNPLKSFTQLAGAPPPITPSSGERMAHVVRPLVVASPSTRNGKPAGVVIGQKSSHVPVGRAAAQPRVNVNNIYAPYASCTIPEKATLQRENVIEAQPLQASASTEELNAQMENLDTMIDDLQALQHEFSAAT
ncbi:immunoglobulin I-set domain-containing protein [Loa loa]|uniref:Immunoglobulin I-set domain-containing protein n=1 Tax=Loa loa TaxID=7209 RepID=A0A1S0UHR6_LOALO|nr:immunoglobulin I-set domain-containing protein [Loa loa]EJD75220.1 immunoglobulin I-set domain-containing protein [Loa loa]